MKHGEGAWKRGGDGVEKAELALTCCGVRLSPRIAKPPMSAKRGLYPRVCMEVVML